MAFFITGNKPIHSTTALFVNNPSTASLIAEIDFNGTNASSAHAGGRVYGVTWILGTQTTLALFVCEQSNSTALALSSAGEYGFFAPMSSGASQQFFTKHDIQNGQRLRVRVASSYTGVATAYIMAEPLA